MSLDLDPEAKLLWKLSCALVVRSSPEVKRLVTPVRTPRCGEVTAVSVNGKEPERRLGSCMRGEAEEWPQNCHVGTEVNRGRISIDPGGMLNDGERSEEPCQNVQTHRWMDEVIMYNHGDLGHQTSRDEGSPAHVQNR